MKGLLRKDLYMLWYYCKSFLLMILIFCVLSLSSENKSFYTVYPVMLTSILPVTLISYDERSGWNHHCQTLPLPRSIVVLEKYLISVICNLVILSLTAVIQWISFSREPVFLWDRYFNLMSTMFVLSFFSPSMVLPLIFKYGSEKGRIAYYFAIGIACALSTIFTDRQFPVLPLPNLLMSVVALGFMYGSYRLSVLFYQKREL